MRPVARLAAASALLLLGAASEPPAEPPEPRIETLTPVDEATVLELLPAGSGSLPVNLAGVASCDRFTPRRPLVTLRWVTASADGRARVEITALRDGFDGGRYQRTDDLSAGTSAIRVAGLEPGLNYYWRVRTETDAGWTTSEVARVEVIVCPADLVLEGMQ